MRTDSYFRSCLSLIAARVLFVKWLVGYFLYRPTAKDVMRMGCGCLCVYGRGASDVTDIITNIVFMEPEPSSLTKAKDQI